MSHDTTNNTKTIDDLGLADDKIAVDHVEQSLEVSDGPLAAAIAEVEALSPEQWAIEHKKLVRKVDLLLPC